MCPYLRTIHTNRAGTLRVTADCAAPADIVAAKWFILPPAMEYYYKPRHSNYYELPPFAPGCTDGSQGTVMEMIYPKNNERIYITIEIDGKIGRESCRERVCKYV